MVREFKKTGVAAAVAGALLASASAQAAVQLSEPGDVLLVPYVKCDTANNLNTMVGLITFEKDRLGLRDSAFDHDADPATPGIVRNYSAPWSLATGNLFLLADAAGRLPGPNSTAALPAGRGPLGSRSTTKYVHWYFYDTSSQHRIDGRIPVTDNDFVRFNWCAQVEASGAPANLQGMDGYLVFNSDEVNATTDMTAITAVPSFALYGHAYQIQGNWASQAFIPVLVNPVHEYWDDGGLAVSAVNVVKRGGTSFPAFSRLLSGTDFTYTGMGAGANRDVFMRYFLDPALATENRMVFWFNFGVDQQALSLSSLGYTQANFPGYVVAGDTIDSLRQTRNVPIETYDSEQVYVNSDMVAIPKELNIFLSTPTAPRFYGMTGHSETETYAVGQNARFTVMNTGVTRFTVPEAVMQGTVGGVANTTLTIPFISSGVAFNMLSLGAGANTGQLQTEMATTGEAY